MSQGVRQVRVDVQPDAGPGWARLVLSGAGGPETPDRQSVRMSLQRNQDGRFLDERSGWSASEVWHVPHGVTQSGADLILRIGPELVDELLADPRTVCRIQVQAQGDSWAGVLRMGQGIYPSGAAGQSPAAARQIQPPAQDVQEPAAVAPPEETERKEPFVAIRPDPPRREPAMRKMPILLLLLLLALLGLAIAWYAGLLDRWLKEPVVGQQTAAVEGEQPTGLATAPGPCSLQAMRDQTDDLAFLQKCVQDNPDTDLVMAIIQAGKDAGRCDLIQRLYAHQAQAGNARIALAYAREFDPQTFEGGCFEQADGQTAIYWYEKSLQLDPDQNTVAERVKQLKNDLEAVQ